MSRHDPIAHGDLTYPADPVYREQSRAWIFDELTFVRRAAQAEANLAYEAWDRLPGRDGYAVYRAAQDRADAAQDELATWVHNHPHARVSGSEQR
jgi:hypothetical protein